MSDDIVARLRSNARFFGLIKKGRSATIEPEFCQETAEWSTEAADEIDRLRKERDEAEPLLQELWERRVEATEMRAEIERLRAELCEARQLIFRLQTNAACCRTSPAATTRDGEATFIPEAL